VAYSVPKLTDWSAEALDSAVAEVKAQFDSERDELLETVLKEKAKTQSDKVTSLDLKPFRDSWMSRKSGVITQLNEKWLKAAPREAKGQVGVRVNDLREWITEAVGTVLQNLPEISNTSITVVNKYFGIEPALDITLPGNRRKLGAEHPVIKTMNEIVGVFRNLGYSVEEGPEIETDYYNFEALNFPPNHPARDTQDTLVIANQQNKPLRDRLLLRTHTSPVQIRTMEKQKPPVRVVCPGKVHRNDAPDATHSPIFHQVEGLAVDTNITFCDLKGTLDHAMKALFGSSVKTRFYPSFFPFTEPSADVQISCIFCGGKGQRDGGPCRNCKASGWIELLGCGMVDPNVFGFVDYDTKKYSGFAFGMGVERIAILKYGVDDIQLFFNGDVRFLEQFG
jgi:phenylalanyl-tRNA synthetase alpha chain